MISFPNCKINLGLSVTEKRNDGFHNIETVFYPVMLTDILELLKTDKNTIDIEIRGSGVDGKKEDNLCIKAYNKLKEHYDIEPVKFILYKTIPSGAGLGGGSSDAAYALKMINDFFSLKISNTKLESFASELGSDCSFFIKNQQVFAYGKGDQFKNIKTNLKGLEIVIIKPETSVNTAFAYKLIKPEKKVKSIIEIVENSDISLWKNSLINDFEAPVFLKYPEIRSIKDKLYEKGAVYSSMSGSGSAVYGISEKFDDIRKEHFPGCFYWKGIL
jgi:4-diphosphocytidyl-2-C-methyl-D-erythritol kinase